MITDNEILDLLHALIDTNVKDPNRDAMHNWLRRSAVALAAFVELGVDFDEKGKPKRAA
jgi:hypothetical protein